MFYMFDFNSYKVRVSPSMLSVGSVIRPDAVLELCTSVIDADLCAFGYGVSDMLSDNLAWVITSVTVDILKPLTRCCELTAKTRPMCARGTFVCREIVLYDNDGECIHSYITSVLFDAQKREIVHTAPPSFSLESLSTKGFPRRQKITCPLADRASRQIQNCDLDCIGHVNNSRYAAFAYDLLSTEKLDKIHEMNSFYISFKHELKKESTLLLEYGETCHEFCVKGTADSEVSFEVIFEFGLPDQISETK